MPIAGNEGVPPTMDLSDVNRTPKSEARRFHVDMWVAGGFPFMVGDASGGPHNGLEADDSGRVAQVRAPQAFALCGDPRDAWILKNVAATEGPAVAKAARKGSGPDPTAPSHVVPDYGAIVEMRPMRRT